MACKEDGCGGKKAVVQLRSRLRGTSPAHTLSWTSSLRGCCCLVAKSCLIFATPWTSVLQASLSFTISWSLFKLMPVQSVMPSNHLILCRPLLLPSIIPSTRVFLQGVSSSNQAAKLLELQLQHQSIQRIFRVGLL